MGVEAGEQSEFMGRLLAAEQRHDELERQVAGMRDSVEQLTAAVMRHVTRRQDSYRTPLDLDG